MNVIGDINHHVNAAKKIRGKMTDGKSSSQTTPVAHGDHLYLGPIGSKG
jgi:hypothetical protein